MSVRQTCSCCCYYCCVDFRLSICRATDFTCSICSHSSATVVGHIIQTWPCKNRDRAPGVFLRILSQLNTHRRSKHRGRCRSWSGMSRGRGRMRPGLNSLQQDLLLGVNLTLIIGTEIEQLLQANPAFAIKTMMLMLLLMLLLMVVMIL